MQRCSTLIGSWKLKQGNTTICLFKKWAKSQTMTTPDASGVWSNRNSYSLLVGVQNGRATLKVSLTASYKTKYTLT